MHAALYTSSTQLMDSSSDEEDAPEEKSKQAFQPDSQHIWMSKNPLYIASNRHAFVHFYCALYSPLSWLHNGKEWRNVAQEVRRSFHFTCAVCGLKGATLGCMNKRCNYSVHLPCAMAQGWAPSLVNKCSFQCPAHCLQDEDRRNELNQLELYDLSLGREAVEVSAERSVFADAMSIPYIYIAKNLDSDDTQSNIIDISDVKHCRCLSRSCGVENEGAACLCIGKVLSIFIFSCMISEVIDSVCVFI